MKQVFFILITILFSTVCFSQKRHPYYGGGHHTTSHGGSYPGSINAHHKGGPLS